MKQWQKKVATAVMAMATIGLIAGCGGGDKKAAADTIKIGANLEMTGNQASFGQLERDCGVRDQFLRQSSRDQPDGFESARDLG